MFCNGNFLCFIWYYKIWICKINRSLQNADRIFVRTVFYSKWISKWNSLCILYIYIYTLFIFCVPSSLSRYINDDTKSICHFAVLRLIYGKYGKLSKTTYTHSRVISYWQSISAAATRTKPRERGSITNSANQETAAAGRGKIANAHACD